MSEKKTTKVILPLIVIALGVLGLVGMIAARPKVETKAPEVQPPLIRVTKAQTQDLQLRVSAQGSVAPRTESSLVPEVSGRLEWVSPSLAPGGFFEEGAVLLRIERRDAEVALRQARAARARAQSEVRLAQANLKRSLDLSKQGVVSSAELDNAKNNAQRRRGDADGSRRADRTRHTDLERTEIIAPFAGRVRDKTVDVGQFVNRGTPVATIYAVDFAEVRLPIPDDQLAFVDLPMHYRGENDVPTAAQGRVARADRRQRARVGRNDRSHRGRDRPAQPHGARGRAGRQSVRPGRRSVESAAAGSGRYSSRRRSSVASSATSSSCRAPRCAATTGPGRRRRGASALSARRGGARRPRQRRHRRRPAVRESVAVSPLEAAVDGMSVRVAAPTRRTSRGGDRDGRARRHDEPGLPP